MRIVKSIDPSDEELQRVDLELQTGWILGKSATLPIERQAQVLLRWDSEVSLGFKVESTCRFASDDTIVFSNAPVGIVSLLLPEVGEEQELLRVAIEPGVCSRVELP